MRGPIAPRLLAALALCAAGPAAAQELGHPGAASLYGAPASEIAAVPDAAQVAAAAPPRKSEGSAVAHCTAGPSGVLGGCTIMLQRGPAFGAALLNLAPSYRLTPLEGRPANTDVVISASWPVVEVPADYRVAPKSDRDFMTTATPAVWKYGKPGQAVMNCLIGRLGTAYDCMVVYQRPAGLGFGTMALRFAAYMRFKPALVGGKPTPAGVNIPFNFKAPEVGQIY